MSGSVASLTTSRIDLIRLKMAGLVSHLSSPTVLLPLIFRRCCCLAISWKVSMKKPSQGLYFALLGSFSVAHFDL
jgi:hypothetical protein